MHNAFLRGGSGSGLWIGVVTSGEWETFDQRQFESINGDLGGTWAPAAQIIIGGLGLKTTGVFVADGTGTFNAAVTFNSNVTNRANSSYWNVQTIDGANSGELKFTSGALLTGLAGATATWASAFVHNGTTTCNALLTATSGFQVTAGTVALSSQINVGANLKILNGSGSLTVEAGTTFSVAAPLALSGTTGFVRYRRIDGADANTTYAIADADHISANPLAARNYTMSNTGCTGGEVMSIWNAASTSGRDISIYQHNGSTFIAVLVAAGPGFGGIELINDGSGSASSAWRVRTTSYKP
jgi:hypothetical protein